MYTVNQVRNEIVRGMTPELEDGKKYFVGVLPAESRWF